MDVKGGNKRGKKKSAMFVELFRTEGKVWDSLWRPSLGSIYSLRCSLFLHTGRWSSSHPVRHKSDDTKVRNELLGQSSGCHISAVLQHVAFQYFCSNPSNSPCVTPKNAAGVNCCVDSCVCAYCGL